MWKLRSVLLAVLVAYSAVVLVSAQGSSNSSKWQTLNGDEPVVIARGGFSGLYPDSSENSYLSVSITGSPNTILWCDVQLTKDTVGLCLPDPLLDNGTDAIYNFPTNTKKKYLINGVLKEGFFSVDYTLKQLDPLAVLQPIYSRNSRFDDARAIILRPEDVAKITAPEKLWLNIQHDLFFSQHNLSMRSYVINISKQIRVHYISSPELNFLTSIVTRFKPDITKLIFRFMGQQEIEPSTNQTYGSLLKNLTYIKTFASGIIVPKSYIWPVGPDLYLQPVTSLVLDAHKAGLEIYGADFASDVPFAYNYSFDPVKEILSFIDNGKFSVDGLLTDFHVTASETIDCYSHMGQNDKQQVPLVVISNEGASGDYPGCTDLAYNKAITDGVDVLDCPVQITQDGTLFCLGSINLLDKTDVAQSEFGNLLTSIPDLKVTNGIFAFNLTWAQIQTLNPLIATPYPAFTIYRNPRFRNAGKLMLFSDFLNLAKNSTVSGVLISIENAKYLVESQGLSVVDSVLDTLSKSGYNETTKKVMIQSTSSSVLEEVNNTSYERVYQIDENIRDILNSTILDIKSFASSVVINKQSVFPTDVLYTTGQTKVVDKIKAFNISVYARLFSNEFPSQAWDFFSDAYFEINNYVMGGKVDGVVSDFPATANKYRRNRCLGYKVVPPYMSAVPPRGLISQMSPLSMPPVSAPSPILSVGDVDEAPLPDVVKKPTDVPAANAPAVGVSPPGNGQSNVLASVFLSCFAVFLAMIILS